MSNPNKPVLYVSHNCSACLEVMDHLHATAGLDLDITWVHPAINTNTLDKEYILLATGTRTYTIPGLPALLDGEKMLVGKEVLAYLKLLKN